MVYEENSKIKKVMMIGAIVFLGILMVPQAVRGLDDCQPWQHDYLTCINSHTPISDCYCCLVPGGGDLAEKCPGLLQCDKPIGVLITNSGITLTNRASSSLQFIPPSCSAIEWRTVGILAKTLPEGGMTNVQLDGMRVQGWANGVLFWRMQGGEIKNSIIRDNDNGIYVFNSQDNTIHANVITSTLGTGLVFESNKTGMSDPRREAKTENNTIYNNYFRDLQDVSYLMVGWGGGVTPWSNTFNIANTSGLNILGQLGEVHGDYIGGNFWGTPDGTGFSETPALCNCNETNGFCDNEYLVYESGAKPNIDQLPLCQPPFIEMTVSGDIYGWLLHQGPNGPEPGIDVTITTNSRNWHVDVSDGEGSGDSEGHVVKYTSPYPGYDRDIYLQELLELTHGDTTVDLLYGNYFIQGSTPVKSAEYPITLSQTVVPNDKILPPGNVYRVVIVFTATAG